MGVVKGWEGRFYEDFEIGDVYRSTLGRTISEVDNTWFTNLTLNTNQSHFNAAFAEASPFGKILLMAMMFMGRVGPLTLAVALAGRVGAPRVRYPEGKVMIG